MNISVSGLYKSYKNFSALKDISFEINSGDILGILGANGAGKTTLLRIITGIIPPTHGHVLIDNQQLTNALILKNIGYLPEERGLYKNMKAIDCILFLASLKNISTRAATEFVQKKIQDLEIDFDLNKPVGSFSKGMQQKVQLLTAIIHQPAVLILDEPFSGLDPMNSQTIKKEILNLSRQGTTILMSTHRMDTFEDLCKSYLFLKKGEVLAKGTKTDLLPKKNTLKLHLRTMYTFTNDELVYQKQTESGFEYLINPQESVNDLMKRLLSDAVEIVSINPHTETLEDVFIQMNRNTDHA
ncbi:MAG TPA: ATP-binding cassette domain-containing protein [Cytophagales bacterium]|nr:ATP-binding cassette domain-containing protein [Cytophagales bacterium]